MTDEQIIQKAKEAGMTGDATPAVIEFVRNLLEAEIEACAKVCELTSSDMNPRSHWAANECAKLIRARARDKYERRIKRPTGGSRACNCFW